MLKPVTSSALKDDDMPKFL